MSNSNLHWNIEKIPVKHATAMFRLKPDAKDDPTYADLESGTVFPSYLSRLLQEKFGEGIQTLTLRKLCDETSATGYISHGIWQGLLHGFLPNETKRVVDDNFGSKPLSQALADFLGVELATLNLAMDLSLGDGNSLTKKTDVKSRPPAPNGP